MFRSFTSLFPLLLLFASCRPSETSADSEGKDISELTYVELWQLLLESHDGAGIDVHGEGFGTAAIGVLEIIEGEACDCGRLLELANRSEEPLSAIVSAGFTLPGNPIKKIDRIYRVPARSSASLGCSHICYDDKSYLADRQILSAGFDSGGE